MAGKIIVCLQFLFFFNLSVQGYELQQVLILSRHNIRAPLLNNLNNLTTYSFPRWNIKPGYLTEKGAKLERYIGHYITDWLAKKGLLPNGCPELSSIHVYANTRQRTRETAKAFVNGAFPNCNITVYSKNSDEMDPLFNPIVRNRSSILKETIVNEMQQRINKLKLHNAYVKLNEITNLKHSNKCLVENFCDFAKERDDVVYEVGQEPNVIGPLYLSNALVDVFLMSFYEGMSLNDVAWGKIRTPKEWRLYTDIVRENLNVRFNGTALSKEVARPLLMYINDILKSESAPKLTLLVGHDANINSVMAAIGFKSYVLPDQFELTPLGGKLVFQRWYDRNLNRNLLKVDYVYPTFEQLRNGERLSQENPPHWVHMELKKHNLRTPLSKNLQHITPYTWPEWKEKPGILTQKGFMLESYMGTYFKDWLHDYGLSPDSCPDEDLFYVYADLMQRTLESAKAFVLSAYPNCNIVIHRSVNKSDPVFRPYIHNNSDSFRRIAISEMEAILNSLDLRSSYENMESILNYRASDSCKLDKRCEMVGEKNVLNISVGEKPSVKGPLKLCNEVIDSFLMEYYNGFAPQNVAWGKLSQLRDWQSILDLTVGYHSVTYNTTLIAKDIAKPLIMFMKPLFTNESPKVSLLMGHDSNINVLLKAMDFKNYMLNNSLVSVPIGGKIVLQKWYDVVKKEYLLKIEYIYQSTEQVRDMVVVSRDIPPQFLTLELKSCPVNEEGFCPWDVFIKIVNPYKLDKVVIFSRHSVRTPSSYDLEHITPHKWPDWKEKPGTLTQNGHVLESYMGTYFRGWLSDTGLLPDSCPDEDLFYVYADLMQRTLASAEAFVRSAFPDCNIIIHSSDKKSHSVLRSHIHNSSDSFREIAIHEMKVKRNGLHLKKSYKKMESILKYQHSDRCKEDKKCDMASEKNVVKVKVGKKPKVKGPLQLCNEVTDTFLMEYYNGLARRKVAWGKISSKKDWHSILGLYAGYHDVVYNTTHVAKDIAKPIIMFMKPLFTNESPKVSLLMGHDSNINVLLKAMHFKNFVLNKSLLSVPIGGKIVFQKWYDVAKKDYFLKIQYVYQSTKQIRKMVVLSRDTPPQFSTLELKGCAANEEGYCPWDYPIRLPTIQESHKKWMKMLEEAQTLVKDDQDLQVKSAAGFWIKTRALPPEVLGRLYTQYCVLINNMYNAYLVSVHLQRAPYILEIISILMKRLYELRNELVHLIVNDYIYVDEALIQSAKTPFDIQIVVPYHVPLECRTDSMETFLQRMWLDAEIRKNNPIQRQANHWCCLNLISMRCISRSRRDFGNSSLLTSKPNATKGRHFS
ncbi:unnamed protein product [Leptidea sinapis]|uniref:Glucose-1-phosphatase n=1 Tax=Leptidea sinapis TaxID=189913 RepID=A0A5E4QE85_9NEOP|nr:unnamed protein product [Leptidea sinapis]